MMIRTQIQLTEEQAQALKSLATARRISVAELIRQSVDDYLLRAGSVDPDERRRRAISAAGRFRSGKKDISANHDDHLVEAYRG